MATLQNNKASREWYDNQTASSFPWITSCCKKSALKFHKGNTTKLFWYQIEKKVYALNNTCNEEAVA